MSLSIAQTLEFARVKGDLVPSSTPRSSSTPVPKGLSGVKDSCSSARVSKPPSLLLSTVPTPPLPVNPYDSPVRPSRTSEQDTITPPRTMPVDPKTPEHRTPIEALEDQLLNSPAPYHKPERLVNPWGNSQQRKKISRMMRRLPDRPVHTLALGESPQRDMAKIRARNCRLTEKGTIEVETSSGGTREYATHPSGNGRYSVFPLRGDNLLTLRGADLQKELAQFTQAKSAGKASSSFAEHLAKYVYRTGKSTDSGTSSSQSLPPLLSPSFLSNDDDDAIAEAQSPSTPDRPRKFRRTDGSELLSFLDPLPKIPSSDEVVDNN